MNLPQENIFLTALEPSAFNYGIRILEFLLPKYNVYTIFSLSYLKNTNLVNHPNLNLVYNSDKLTVLGIFEIFSKYKLIKNLLNDVKLLVNKKNFKFILSLDAWAFNEKIHKIFLKYQTLTRRYHFIAPKTWAWGSFRNKSLKILDKLFCIFPFEEKYFKSFDINAIYVGNPLLDIIPDSEFLIRQKLKNDFHAKKEIHIVLMPGSRPQEIKNLLPFLLKISKKILKRLKEKKYFPIFHMPLTPNIAELIKKYNIPDFINLSFGNSLEILKKADLGIIASGTASLEAALCGVPHVVIYKLNLLTYLLGRFLIKIPYISLVNILLKQNLIKEHIQFLNENKILNDFLNLLENKNLYLKKFLILKKQLRQGCFENLKKFLI